MGALDVPMVFMFMKWLSEEIKMKKLLLGLSIIAGCVTFYSVKDGECGWCPSYKCFGPCGGSCVCMSQDHSGGACVDIQRVPEFEANGWNEMK